MLKLEKKFSCQANTELLIPKILCKQEKYESPTDNSRDRT